MCGVVEMYAQYIASDKDYKCLYDLAHSMFREPKAGEKCHIGYTAQQYGAGNGIPNGGANQYIGVKAFCLFSHHSGETWCTKFAKQIKELQLGELTEFGPTLNPCTGRQIHLWVWKIDEKAFRAWYQKETSGSKGVASSLFEKVKSKVA
jgi:hypothetical protein